MKTIKKLVAIVMVVCMSMVLVACGGKKASNSEPDTTGVNQAQVTTPAEVTSKAEDKAEPREAELNIMMGFPQYMDQWETYCKQFED